MSVPVGSKSCPIGPISRATRVSVPSQAFLAFFTAAGIACWTVYPHYPYYGDKYAELTVKNDKAGIDKEPVYWGDSDDLLAKGVVQSNYSAYIGATGRVVLAAHNHTYFRYLPNILVGDQVILKTDYGKFTYEVTETKVLPDTDTSLLYYDVTADPPVDDLILYTCWNNGYMGLSDQRLYVICKVVSKEYKN